MLDTEETIVAIASPTAPAPRGIVRLSGMDLSKVLSAIGLNCGASTMPSRRDCQLDLGDPIGLLSVDLYHWPTSRSYTGQPSAEIHSVGSLPILNAVVARLSDHGARAARPGEFTMRAFLAGRLDLTQAEAVLGVIEAEKRGSLDHALRQLAGNLSKPLERMRSDMLDLLADVEAGLDFVDEDIEFISDEVLVVRLQEIHAILMQTRAALSQRGGGAAKVSIALRGQPNAGKSQLINRLAGKDAAIVADVAGTTRDSVVVDCEIEGFAVQLIDTAGIEEAADLISDQAQVQANEASRHAGIRLWCVDSSLPDFDSRVTDLNQIREQGALKQSGVKDVWVATKSDLVHQLPVAAQVGPWIETSSVSGEGLGRLKELIVEILQLQDQEESGSVVGTAARCGDTLRSATEAIEAAIGLCNCGDGQEFIAAELRIAVEALGEVTGTVYTDDILDRVFGRFCIGK